MLMGLQGAPPKVARPLLALSALVLLGVVVSGCMGPGTSPESGRGVEGLRFRSIVVDAAQEGAEPSLAFGSDGTAFICSIRGLGGGTFVWRSLDGGASFEPTGRMPVPNGPILRSGGGDLGGGDCDLAVDAGGTVYLVDLWLGSASLAVSRDRGETWTGIPATMPQAPLDRPWALAGEPGEVWLSGAQGQGTGLEGRGQSTPPAGGIWVAHSTDGGLTFPQQVLAVSNQDRLGLNSNLASGYGNLYLTYTKKVGEGRLAMMVAVSTDQGLVWEQREAAVQEFYPGQCFSPLSIFPVVAADDAGGVYLAWVLKNPRTGRADLFFAASPDEGRSWGEPLLVTDREGTRQFPWIVAGDAGRVGLAWYETNVTTMHDFTEDPAGQAGLTCSWETPEDAAWDLHYAFTSNARAPGPSFQEVRVQEGPIHVGPLDRPFAEVLQVEFDPQGRAAIAYVADVVEGEARPMFALQVEGPRGRTGSDTPAPATAPASAATRPIPESSPRPATAAPVSSD